MRIISKHLFLQLLNVLNVQFLYYARFTSSVSKERPYNFIFDRVGLVRVSVRPFLRTYLRLYLRVYFRIYSLVFPEILDSDKNLATEIDDRINFSRKFLFALKWAEWTQNVLSWVFVKFCQYFLLEVTYNGRSYNSLICCVTNANFALQVFGKNAQIAGIWSWDITSLNIIQNETLINF